MEGRTWQFFTQPHKRGKARFVVFLDFLGSEFIYMSQRLHLYTQSESFQVKV